MTYEDAFDDIPTSKTLLVTVRSTERFYDDGRAAIERLDRGESVTDPDTLSFASVAQLFETFTPRTMELLGVVADERPTSIRETARVVERDVKNVHDELTTLERLGVIRFEQDGRSKQPILPYEEVIITVPFTRDDAVDATAAS